MSAGLVLAHEPAEADHIRVQNGRKLAPAGAKFFPLIGRAIEQGAHCAYV
jgi:hypothetical protein